MNNLRQRKTETFEDYMSLLQNTIASSKINCHRIGSIVSFDSETQRAVVQMVDYITISDDETSVQIIPNILPNVPVNINATIAGGFTIPINEGDFCLLAFNDRDLTNWLLSGNLSATELASNRTHSFSDGIAIVGIFPNPVALPDYNNDGTEMFYGNIRISLSGGNITFTTENAEQVIIDADGNLMIAGNTTIGGNETIEGNTLEIGGIILTASGGKLLLNGKEIAVVGGITNGSPTTQTITTSGQ